MKAVAPLGHDARIDALRHLSKVIRYISDGSPITGRENDFPEREFLFREARNAPASEWAAIADLIRKSPTEEEFLAASAFREEFEEAIARYLITHLVINEENLAPISIEMLNDYEERDLALRGFGGFDANVDKSAAAYVTALRKASKPPWTEDRIFGLVLGLSAGRVPEARSGLEELVARLPEEESYFRDLATFAIGDFDRYASQNAG